MSNVGSGIAAGAASGAATGAGVGTAASPGIGTAIGAAIGAIGGAIAGGVTAKQNEKNREKEVKRIEEREDNAIRRATADSLLSGIDPRSSGQAPTAASAGSVAPQELPEALSDFVQAGGQFANSVQRRASLDVETSNLVGKGFQEFISNSSEMYNATFAERDKVMSDMAVRLGVTTEELRKVENSYMTLTKNAIEKYDSWTKSEQYHTFVDKLNSVDIKDFSKYIDANADELYRQYCLSFGAEVGNSDSKGGNSNQGSSSSYVPKYNPKSGIIETVANKAVDGVKILSKAEFLSNLKANYSRQNADTERYSHGHEYGWDKNESEGTKVTTGNISNEERVHKAVTSIIKETAHNYVYSTQLADKMATSKISDEDMKQYSTALARLDDNLDYYSNLRNIRFDQYVSYYFPRLRKVLKSMKYGSLDAYFGELYHMFGVSREFDFDY